MSVSGAEGVPGGTALCKKRGSEFVVAENMLNGALVNLHEVIKDGEACLKAWGEDVVACNRNAEFMGVTANETADLVKKIMGAENGANCTVDTTVSALKKEVDQKKAAFDEAVKKTERLVVLARDAQKLCSAVTGNVDDRFLRLSSTLKNYEDHLGYKEYSVCVTPEKTERVTEVKRLHDELSGIKRRLDVMKGHTQVCRVIGGAVSPVGIMNKALKDLSSTCGQEITSSEIKVPVEGKGEKSERYDEAVILPDGRLRKNATDKTTMVSMKAGEQFPFIKGSALQTNKTTVQRFKKTFDTARKIVIEERRKNEEKRLAEEWERKEREKKEKEERERAAAA
ncbi:hypothetical protein LSM04_006136 [Trypanosoma melophagium]|uniref:uncharacterized protein n=1 Tax=Trypanosoma melophagium TaxID=715481 RepID=UPI00351A654D|nr:hypothetical protein LSM04_006136 [Trypanosoma melophagium]